MSTIIQAAKQEFEPLNISIQYGQAVLPGLYDYSHVDLKDPKNL